MDRKHSALTLFIVLGTLLAIGLACGNSDNTATTNTGTTSAANSGNTSGGISTAPAPKDISGQYDATGTNVNGGGNYKASLVVTPHDDVYQFSWNSGGKDYDGVGVKTDNAVAVSYTDGPNGKGCGVVLYKIGPDGTLDGKAGYWGVNKSEAEKAVRKQGTDLEGQYDITGTNTDGKEYKGQLNVKKDGEGYTFSWNAGATFEGFGVKSGDKVAVGFGGKQCAFVSYDVDASGTLNGKWGGQGAKTFGTEVAKKK